MTVPADKPIVDLRVYTIRPRRMAEFLDVFDRLAMPVQMRYFDPPIGFYTSMVGTLNQVVHLWAFADLADFQRRHAARDTDPDWPAYLRASIDMVVAQETRLVQRAALPFLAGAERA